jgi:hypothetical protein
MKLCNTCDHFLDQHADYCQLAPDGNKALQKEYREGYHLGRTTSAEITDQQSPIFRKGYLKGQEVRRQEAARINETDQRHHAEHSVMR